MAEAIRPGNILKSTIIDKPSTLTGGGKGRIPTVPGSGRGLDPERRQPPKKSHKLRNTLLTTSLLGGIGGGAYIATKGGNEPSQTSSPTVATVETTQPPLTSPDTTTITSTVPTTETPTTIVERVFSSPEQQAQVEAVEMNMSKFFALTPENLAKYQETTRFDLDPDGFSTAHLSSTDSSAGVVGIDLGTFQIPVGDGVAFIVATGHMTEDGSQYVLLQYGEITDSTLQTVWFNYEGVTTNVFKGTVVDGVTTYPLGTSAETVSRSNGRTAMIADLNASVGEPVYALYIADPVKLSSPDYPVEPSPILVDAITRITRASEFSLLGSVLSEYSTDTLKSVGVYKEMSLISQNTLAGYETAAELLSNMTYNIGFRLFDGVPTVI